MNFKQLILCGSFVGLSLVSSPGQITCSPAATTITRQPLVCLLPYSQSSGAAAAQGQQVQNAIQSVSLAINGTIATQLTQVPVPSGSSGTITLLEKGNPSGRAFDDLGAVLTERPETIGKNHLYAGFTYQHFNFNAIDGLDIKSLNFGYSVLNQKSILTDYGRSVSNVGFRLEQYVALLTYGVSRTRDITVAVPFNSISISSNVQQPIAFTYTPPTVSSGGSYAVQSTSSQPVAGTASGIGDVKFGVKQQLYGIEGNSLAVSAGLGFRIPTGDAYNFLGSGAYGVDIYGLISYRSFTSRISPHFKLGKQWNGPTVLLNPTGQGDTRLPGGMQYSAGTDVRAYKRKLTFAVDVIGSEFVNSPSLVNGTPISLNPVPTDPRIPTSLTFVQPTTHTYTTVSFSGGLKYNPYRNVLVYGNVLVQLNNVGLRSDPVPLAGVAYNFNLHKTD